MATSAALRMPIVDTLRIDPCNLCPRLCGSRREHGERGVCGAGDHLLLARAALHFWEEPPLSGERGSGALFFVNCPLKCVYCQNATIAHGEAGVSVSVEQLASVMCDLQRQGALNINCVTPTHYAIDIARAVAQARSSGLSIPVVWNTSGYEREDAVSILAGTVNVYLADFKYASSEMAARYSHAPDYPEVALCALETMVDAVGEPCYDEVDGMPRMTSGVVVRHLLLPGGLEESKKALALLHERFGMTVCYSIMNQYTPVLYGENLERFPELGRRASDEEYEQLLDYADSIGIEDYCWQDGPAAEESFIPAWDGEGLIS